MMLLMMMIPEEDEQEEESCFFCHPFSMSEGRSWLVLPRDSSNSAVVGSQVKIMVYEIIDLSLVG